MKTNASKSGKTGEKNRLNENKSEETQKGKKKKLENMTYEQRLTELSLFSQQKTRLR